MNELNFTVSSALKDLIGKDLIQQDNIAIFELVKNSYDAYAEDVEISFEDDKITIADNGKGMSYDDLLHKWLFLAYSAKKDGSEDYDEKQTSYRDKINRHYAGAKGVGRFSCDRLGEKLILTTRSKKTQQTERLIVNWKDFELDQKKEFGNVKILHEIVTEQFEFPDNKEYGTVLEIQNLHSEWNRTKILELKRSLEKLINPFSETSDFHIRINCKKEIETDINKSRTGVVYDRDIVNGEVKNSIAEIIDLKTTKIEVKLNAKEIYTTLIDRDSVMYQIRENNYFHKLKEVEINLYFLNRAAKTAFTKNMGVEPVNYGSIFLFRNGFRILPFGDTGDDSWGLDYRAQQGYNRSLSTRDLFGRVDIQTDNIDEFKEVSSRDGGLIESETTLELQHLFEIALKRLERYVIGVLWGGLFLQKKYFQDIEQAQKNKEKLKQDKFEESTDYLLKSNIGSKIDFIQLIKTLIDNKNIEVLSYNKELSNIFEEPDLFDNVNPDIISGLERFAEKTNDADLKFSISEAKKKIAQLEKDKNKAEQRALEAEEKATKAIEEKEQAQYEKNIAEVKQEKAEKKAELAERENLFLSSDLDLDIKQFTCLQHTITHTAASIRTKINKAMDAIQNNEKEIIIKALNDIYLLNQQIATVSSVVSKVNYNLNVNKIKKDIVEFIYEYVENICVANYQNLKFNFFKNNISYTMKFESLKLMIIIDNLLSNSEKANSKKIDFDWSEDADYIIMRYKDDGIGIHEENLEKVFDYRFSTTEGGGLGLYHIKNIIEKEFKGSIRTLHSDRKGASFELRFKKEK